jgi:hypothetical protein
MAFFGPYDGSIQNHRITHKYGVCSLRSTLSDVWTRADSTPLQSIWLAPTAPRIHSIVSTSANDTLLGTGARKLAIQGLIAWGQPGVQETVVLNGTTPVLTVNPYVMINTLSVSDSNGLTNVGTITATAQVDNTITSIIQPMTGFDQSAIWGIPAGRTGYVNMFAASIRRSGGQTSLAEIDFMVNNQQNQTTAFIERHKIFLSTGATSALDRDFHGYLRYIGPVLFKIQGTATVNDTECTAALSLITTLQTQ